MKKILVIEDTLEVRENICEILELAGYQVDDAPDGKIGVEKAMNNAPDLILCDVMMPELDGFGVLKILNKRAETNKIPFIFLTAKAEKSDFRKGMGLGADDYITKPFDDAELLDAIEMRLKKHEQFASISGNSDEGIKRLFSEARAKDEFEKLSEGKETRSFNRKDMVFEAGGVPRWLYLIIEGQVKLYRNNEFGKELITHLYKEGEFFGYFPLINESNFDNSAVALTDSKLRLIPKEDFMLLLYNNREFAAQFIKMLSNSMNSTEQELIELAYSSVRRKVANALVAFATTQLNQTNMVIRVSRDNLASRAGTAKETLIRTLSDFKSEGLIDIDGGAISIQDLKKLQSMPQ